MLNYYYDASLIYLLIVRLIFDSCSKVFQNFDTACLNYEISPLTHTVSIKSHKSIDLIIEHRITILSKTLAVNNNNNNNDNDKLSLSSKMQSSRKVARAISPLPKIIVKPSSLKHIQRQISEIQDPKFFVRTFF